MKSKVEIVPLKKFKLAIKGLRQTADRNEQDVAMLSTDTGKAFQNGVARGFRLAAQNMERECLKQK